MTTFVIDAGPTTVRRPYFISSPNRKNENGQPHFVLFLFVRECAYMSPEEFVRWILSFTASISLLSPWYIFIISKCTRALVSGTTPVSYDIFSYFLGVRNEKCFFVRMSRCRGFVLEEEALTFHRRLRECRSRCMALDNNKYKVKNGRKTRVQAAAQFHNRELRLSSSRGQKTKNKKQNSIPKRPGPSRELLLSLCVCIGCCAFQWKRSRSSSSFLHTSFLPFRLLFTLSFSLSPFFSFLWLAGRSRRESSVRQRQWEIDILIYYTKGNRSRFFKNLTENNKKLVPHLKEEDSSRKWTFPYVTQVVSWVKFFFLPPTK